MEKGEERKDGEIEIGRSNEREKATQVQGVWMRETDSGWNV